MTFKEMVENADEEELMEMMDVIREVQQSKQQAWIEEQRAKARTIIDLLQQHLPPEALHFLAEGHGCEYIRDVMYEIRF
jgi:hypothetical protein